MAQNKISAHEVVADIKAGMSDESLMAKYDLSSQGVQRLLLQLMDKGLVKESDLSRRTTEPAQEDIGLDFSEPSPQGAGNPVADEAITLHGLFGDWYESKKTLILLLISVTPVGLYGLYKTSLFSQKAKIGIGILTSVLALAAISPALRLWLMGVVGIGAYALYKLLPFGKTARIATAVVAGMMVVGMIGPLIDGDSRRSGTVPAQPVVTTQPAPQPVQPKPVPVAQPAPVPTQPVQVAQPAAQPKAEPKQKSTASGKPLSEITWSEVRGKFIDTDSDLTKAQKPREWATNYKGKWVRWNGYVTEVREGWGGGISLNVDMLTKSLTGIDLIFSVKKDQQEKALKLKKNDKITFVGRMESEPGSIMAMSLEDVIIE